MIISNDKVLNWLPKVILVITSRFMARENKIKNISPKIVMLNFIIISAKNMSDLID